MFIMPFYNQLKSELGGYYSLVCSSSNFFVASTYSNISIHDTK